MPVYTAVIDVASTTTAIPETPQFHTFMNQVPAGMLLATVTVQAGMSNEGGTSGLAVGTPDGLATLHDRLDKFSKQVDLATIVTAQLSYFKPSSRRAEPRRQLTGQQLKKQRRQLDARRHLKGQ